MSVSLKVVLAIQGELSHTRHVWGVWLGSIVCSQYIWLFSIAPSLIRVLQDLQDLPVSVALQEVW